jgi:uncharacterized repeat protein (TIGR01451 family)
MTVRATLRPAFRTTLRLAVQAAFGGILRAARPPRPDVDRPAPDRRARPTARPVLPTLAALAASVLLAACGGGSPDRSDVVVTGSATTGPVASGSEIEFRVVIGNQGPDAAYNLSIEQTLDERLTLLEIRCEAQATTCPSTPALNMGISTLSAGSTLTFTVRASAPLGLAGSVTHRVVVRDVASDTDGTNNNLTLPVAVGNADLSVSYTAPAETPAGEPAVFTATIVNLGNAPAALSSLAYTVPVGTTRGTVECEASGGVSCPADLSANPLSVGPWPTGGRLRLRLPFTPAADQRGAISSQFTADTVTDGVPENDSASASSTAITPPANLSATLTAPAVVRTGGELLFTARISNGGPNPANNVSFSFTPPPGRAVNIVNCTPSAGFTCPATLSSSFSLASLPAAAFLQLRFSVTADVADGTVLSGSLSVSADGDPAVDNNLAQAQGTARDAVANVSVSQSVAASTPVGSAAVFLADVLNDGPDTAAAVRLAYSANIALTGATLSCEALGGATCPTALTDLSAVDVTSLPSGASLQFRLTVPTTGLAAGAAVSATLTATHVGDPFPADSTATAVTTLSAALP